MARSLSMFILFIFIASSVLTPTAHGFGTTMKRELLGLKKEKLTQFRVYWHDITTGKDPTSVIVVPPTNSSTMGFGMIRVIDNALTMGPELNSTVVGQAQGFYAQAAKDYVGLLMAMNFAFKEGKYNGSSITILGRNEVFQKVREMPVIGGSGLFRFARGYVQARTHWLDMKSGDATVEYSCYVLHY